MTAWIIGFIIIVIGIFLIVKYRVVRDIYSGWNWIMKIGSELKAEEKIIENKIKLDLSTKPA